MTVSENAWICFLRKYHIYDVITRARFVKIATVITKSWQKRQVELAEMFTFMAKNSIMYESWARGVYIWDPVSLGICGYDFKKSGSDAIYTHRFCTPKSQPQMHWNHRLELRHLWLVWIDPNSESGYILLVFMEWIVQDINIRNSCRQNYAVKLVQMYRPF